MSGRPQKKARPQSLKTRASKKGPGRPKKGSSKKGTGALKKGVGALKKGPAPTRQGPSKQKPGQSPRSRAEKLQKSEFSMGGSGERLVPGLHSVSEVIRVRPDSVKSLAVDAQIVESSAELRPLVNWAESRGVPVQRVRRHSLENFSSGHQGVMASVTTSPEVDWEELKTTPRACLAILDEVSDPHNLGAVLRSAWLLGMKAILVPGRRSASLSPVACKVASGGAEHVPVEEVGQLTAQIDRLRDWGFWVYGLSAEDSAQSLFEVDLPEKVAWVLGSEGQGLRKPTARACDELVQIPQTAKDASLNVSVAAALAFAEFHRAHKN